MMHKNGNISLYYLHQVRFIFRHTDCMPPLSKGFALCTLAIHAMSDYQYTGEIDNVGSYIKV